MFLWPLPRWAQQTGDHSDGREIASARSCPPRSAAARRRRGRTKKYARGSDSSAPARSAAPVVTIILMSSGDLYASDTRSFLLLLRLLNSDTPTKRC